MVWSAFLRVAANKLGQIGKQCLEANFDYRGMLLLETLDIRKRRKLTDEGRARLSAHN
jgi:hypothetical protein